MVGIYRRGFAAIGLFARNLILSNYVLVVLASWTESSDAIAIQRRNLVKRSKTIILIIIR
jgi:hypothetical protein